jgi:hypothetical protein
LRLITVEVSSSSERSEDLIIQFGIPKNIPSASERKLLQDLRVGLARSSTKKKIDPDNESNEHIKRDMYLDNERTKRS